MSQPIIEPIPGKARLFLWGLSNGIIALTIATLFWMGLGLGPYAGSVEWYVDALVAVVVYGCCGICIWGAVRLRRRSGFRREDLRTSDPGQRSENRKTVLGFIKVVVAQSILIVAVVIWCLQPGNQELLWPLIAIVVSLHFVPLGIIFHVRAYCALGGVGTVVGLSSLLRVFDSCRMIYLGVSMGILMLATVAFLLRKADAMALKSVDETPNQGVA